MIKLKKNILLLVPGLYIGGAERVVANLVKYLDMTKFNVSICHLKGLGEIGEELKAGGYDVFGISNSNSVEDKPDYFSFLKLRKFVKSKKIDIIHSHETAALVEGALCRIITPKIKHIHTFHFGNYPNYPKADKRFEKIFWRIPDRLVAVGNMQRDAIKQTYNIADNRIDTIWNGVEDTKAESDKSLTDQYRKTSAVLIASVSTLTEQKGITYLLDAAAVLKDHHKNFKILIVGDGPLRLDLENKAKNLSLEKYVTFLGWVPNAGASFLPDVDIFVQPSLWEAMSMVPLEAMAAKKAVVVTNVGENRFVIDHGKNGYLFESKDIDSLVKYLGKLISERELRTRFGQKAREKFEQFFHARVMAKNYENYYLKLLD